MARKQRKPQVTLPYWAQEPAIDPKLIDERGITPERDRQSNGASEWGRGERDRKTVQTMRDSPLEAMHGRGRLTDHQYSAATKYRLHWFHAGMAGALKTIDPNRIFASDMNFDGLAKTESQVFHRQQYRAAFELIGIIPGAVLETIVCQEKPLTDVGVHMGWKSKPKGIQAAEDVLRDALDKLCRHWGIG